MNDSRRREGLGRNRRSPSSQNTNVVFVIGCVAMAAAGWFAYDFFTDPARILGARSLDCASYSLQITELQGASPEGSGAGKTGTKFVIIRGCGSSLEARCTATTCTPVETF